MKLEKTPKHCPHCGAENCKCGVVAEDGGITLVCSVTRRVIGDANEIVPKEK